MTEIKPTRLEKILSGSGMLICILITMIIWTGIGPYQDTLPLPGGYFVELMLGAVICTLALWIQFEDAGLISWIYSGLLAGFIILGLFSVGIFYFPVFLIFTTLSIYSDLKRKKSILVNSAIGLLAGILQVGGMLAIIALFFR